MNELNEILNQALPRWGALTGTKMGDGVLHLDISGTSSFDDFALRSYVEQLNASRTLDASGVATLLMLRGLSAKYMDEVSFSAADLLQHDSAVAARLDALRDFHALVHNPMCDAAIEDFQCALRDATTHYRYDGARLKEVFEDELLLGELRYAAFNSLKTLHVHQFTHGPLDDAPLRYNPTVFEFWNINSLLGALRGQWVSGITMALIRDPQDGYRSYFALGLRNGETLTVLTDFQEGVHPDYYNMTRRPDRRLEERALQHWFPYQFLGSRAGRSDDDTDDDEPLHPTVDDAALVRHNTETIPLGELTDLEPAQFVWTALLFELVAARFGTEGFQTEELSYTAEMVVEPAALVDASDALVKTGQYAPLMLPPLSLEDVTPQAANTDERVGHLTWMEERYAARVPPVVFNVVGEQAALAAKTKALKRLRPPKRLSDDTVLGRRVAKDVELELRALDPTSFGTQDRISKNRAWVARVNLLQGVQRLAEADYAKHRDRIWAWFQKHVEKNVETLLDAGVRGEFLAPVASWLSREREHPEHQTFPLHDKLLWYDKSIVRASVGRTLAHAFPGHYYARGVTFGGVEWPSSKATCYLRPPTSASVFIHFSPNNPRAVALLAGVSEDRLPWALQHWYIPEPYTGNHILDRIDPSDWVLENPWTRLDLNVTISLCKRAWKARRKALGLDPDTNLIEGA